MVMSTMLVNPAKGPAACKHACKWLKLWVTSCVCCADRREYLGLEDVLLMCVVPTVTPLPPTHAHMVGGLSHAVTCMLLGLPGMLWGRLRVFCPRMVTS